MTPESAPDPAVLIAAARTGDLEAQSQLFSLYVGMARATARRLLPTDAAVDDVVQDAFVEALSQLSGLREPRAFGAFLRLNVRKHADRVTRRAAPRWSPFAAGTPELDPLLVVEEREVAEVVRDALSRASDSDRLLLGLRYYAGWTELEIAKAFLISPAAVKKRLHDARRRLRPALSDLAPTPKESTMTPTTTDPRPLLGRRVSPTGSPLDGGAPIDLPTTARLTTTPADEVLATGIKALDVLCPLLRGGTAELLGPEGCGQLVLVGEVSDRLTARDVVVIVVGRLGQAYGNATFGDWVDELGATRAIHVLADGDDQWGEAVAAAASLARAVVLHGSDVLVVVDAKGVDRSTAALAELRQGAGVTPSGSLSVLVVAPDSGPDQLTEPDLSHDTSVVFSRAMTARGWYPAVHPLASRSRWLETLRPDDRHQLVATEAALAIDRAERLRLYLTQPFDVAAAFTGRPGAHVALPDALDDIDTILAGGTAGTPADELAYLGTLAGATRTG